MAYSVAILTVSDTAALAPHTDRSGPILSALLSSHPSNALSVQHTSIVADDEAAIRQTVQHWIDDLGIHLIFTTGGTGFGLRDRTPEALEPLYSRRAPALTHALTAHSLNKTPWAALSRSVTGIRAPPQGSKCTHESLIVALPGSPKAVKECLEILLGYESDGVQKQGILLHALDLLSGGSGQRQHEQMQGSGHRSAISSVAVSTGTDTGHARTLPEQHHTHAHDHHGHHHHPGGHDHHHHNYQGAHGHHHHGKGAQANFELHSHSVPVPRTRPQDHQGSFPFKTTDPASGPSLRHRQSPYPIVPMDDALRLIFEKTPRPADLLAERSERRPVSSDLIGYVLAEDIVASTDLPPGPTTNVDGYAVKSGQTPAGDYRVVTLRTLTERDQGSLQPGEIFRINTGQGLPAGADAVAMVEDTELLEVFPESDPKAPGEEKSVKVLAQVDASENVRKKGSDVREGTVVLRKGTVLSALGGEIGTLAFLGRSEVLVYAKPKVAILSTGNELADIEQATRSNAIESWGFTVFDANRPGLTAAINGMGFECMDLGIVDDSVESTLAALQKGLEGADVVITTGGTSMGESDLLKPLIERHLNGEIHFGRVAMKPGKPTTFATLPHPTSPTTARQIFALPGNPASALVCFYVFVLPALRKLAGYPPSASSGDGWSLPRVPVHLLDSMRLDPRPEFHRAVVTIQDGKLVASSTGAQRSSGMHSMATANALICVPARVEGGKTVLEKGEVAEAILLSSLA